MGVTAASLPKLCNACSTNMSPCSCSPQNRGLGSSCRCGSRVVAGWRVKCSLSFCTGLHIRCMPCQAVLALTSEMHAPLGHPAQHMRPWHGLTLSACYQKRSRLTAVRYRRSTPGISGRGCFVLEPFCVSASTGAKANDEHYSFIPPHASARREARAHLCT